MAICVAAKATKGSLCCCCCQHAVAQYVHPAAAAAAESAAVAAVPLLLLHPCVAAWHPTDQSSCGDWLQTCNNKQNIRDSQTTNEQTEKTNSTPNINVAVWYTLAATICRGSYEVQHSPPALPGRTHPAGTATGLSRMLLLLLLASETDALLTCLHCISFPAVAARDWECGHHPVDPVPLAPPPAPCTLLLKAHQLTCPAPQSRPGSHCCS